MILDQAKVQKTLSKVEKKLDTEKAGTAIDRLALKIVVDSEEDIEEIENIAFKDEKEYEELITQPKSLQNDASLPTLTPQNTALKLKIGSEKQKITEQKAVTNDIKITLKMKEELKRNGARRSEISNEIKEQMDIQSSEEGINDPKKWEAAEK